MSLASLSLSVQLLRFMTFAAMGQLLASSICDNGLKILPGGMGYIPWSEVCVVVAVTVYLLRRSLSRYCSHRPVEGLPASIEIADLMIKRSGFTRVRVGVEGMRPSVWCV